MRTLAIFTRLGLVILFGLISNPILFAQDYWGPDTTRSKPDVESYEELLNHLFGSLLSEMSTDILIDAVPSISRRNLFLGDSHDSLGTMGDLFTIYTEMSEASMPFQRKRTFLEIDSLASVRYSQDSIVPLSILRYRYNEINPVAKENGGLYWDNYQLKTQTTDLPYDLFFEKDVFMLCPLVDGFISDGMVQFSLESEDIFTNLEDPVQAVNIDFDDGQGFREYVMGETIEIYYESPGEKRLRASVQFTDGSYYQGGGMFSARANDNTINISCGSGGIIWSGVATIEDPQDTRVFSVQAPKYNNQSPNPGYSGGTIGIWYGCGNTACRINKPVIISTGYAPVVKHVIRGKDVVGVTEAKNSLFNHINGMYGQDASSSQEPGQNNGTNLLYKLRNEGFDVIIIDFDNGVDYVENHAAIIEEVISWVNEKKLQNGSKYENVIIGQSLGGVSTRYALTEWERKYMDYNKEPYIHHQCRLWISMEGEMQGAIVPLGLQLFTWYTFSRLPVSLGLLLIDPSNLLVTAGWSLVYYKTLKIVKDIVDNPAAKQLLIHHYTDNRGADYSLNPNNEFLNFWTKMDELGYPQCRRVAIANGSSNNARPQQVDEYSRCLADVLIANPLTLGLSGQIRLKAKSEQVFSTTEIFRARFRTMGISIPWFNVTVNKRYNKAYSSIPGSYERFYEMMKPVLSSISWCSQMDYRAPFVATTSVFDIQDDSSYNFEYDMVDNELFYRTPTITSQFFGFPHIKEQEAKTPFDALYASPGNEFHLQNPRTEIASFVVDEVGPDQLAIQNRLFFGAYDVYSARYDARTSITIGREITHRTKNGNVVLVNSDVTLNSPLIRFSDGFRVEEGSRMLAGAIQQIRSKCFQFQGLAEKSDNQYSSSSQLMSIQSKANDFVYPNPATDVFKINTLSNVGALNLNISTLSGTTLLSKSIDIDEEVNISDLPSGAYVVRVQLGESVYTSKLVKL